MAITASSPNNRFSDFQVAMMRSPECGPVEPAGWKRSWVQNSKVHTRV
jgi:hypothetical protein